VALRSGPINRFFPGPESTKKVVRMVLDHIILNWRTFGPAFGDGLLHIHSP
jgi:hypothetical protein